MRTINFNFSDFNLEAFIENYDEKIRLVFGMNQDEPLGRIVEILNHNTLEIQYIEDTLSKEEILEAICKEELALFMPVGGLGDSNMITFRLINMIEYKLKDESAGDLYSGRENFKVVDDILDLGDLNISTDSLIGIVITKINQKIFISFAQYECGSCMYMPELIIKEKTGDLSKEIKDYLYKYKTK